MADKPTQIIIGYEGADYTIEYNLASIKRLERAYDFNVEDMSKGKIGQIPDLFYCGFLMHHPRMKRSTSDAIFSKASDKQGLIAAVAGLYADAVNSMFAEPEEGKGLAWKTA